MSGAGAGAGVDSVNAVPVSVAANTGTDVNVRDAISDAGDALYHLRLHRKECHDIPQYVPKPLQAALMLAGRLGGNGILPVFANDLPNPSNNPKLDGKKHFYVSSYGAFWDHLERGRANRRCAYEILLTDHPTKLHVDIDVDRTINRDLTDSILGGMVQTVVEHIRAQARELFYDVPSASAASEAAAASAEAEIPYTTLNASTDKKLSLHLIFDIFLKNNYHCGAFMRRFRNRLLRAFEAAPFKGDAGRDHPFYINTLEKDRKRPGEMIEMRAFFCDLAIYTMRRNMRLYTCSKVKGEYRPLLLGPERALRTEQARTTGVPVIVVPDMLRCGQSRDVFVRCALQNCPPSARVFECREEDGSEPKSTSKCDFLQDNGHATQSTLTAVASTGSSASASTASQPSLAPALAPSKVRDYWTNVFPYAEVWRLLECTGPHMSAAVSSDSGQDPRREFITRVGVNAPHRHRHCTSAVGLREMILSRPVDTLNIGPLETPTTKTFGHLAFDVDVPDYATWRSCPCGDTKRMCAVCWPIANFAHRALAEFVRAIGLGRAFGFFSGMKGVHVWILSRTTSELSGPQRIVLMDAFEHVRSWPASPVAQAVLGSKASRTQWAKFLTDIMATGAFAQRVAQHGEDAAIIRTLWPEVDRAVTTSVDHPIKSPFSLHTSSGRVATWLETFEDNPLAEPFPDVADNVRKFAAALG